MRKHLARIFELTRRDNLSHYLLNKKVFNFEKDLIAMQATPGENERNYSLEYDPTKQIYRGIQVLSDECNGDTGANLFELDRAVYLKATLAGITGRVRLKDPVHEARASIFNYDGWLEGADLPADYLHAELGVYAKHYNNHFTREFGDEWFDDLLSEWRLVTQTIIDRRDGRWKRYSYNDLWKAVYLHSDTGPKAQLLNEIEMAFAIDTACAECWFSLMANLKEKKRNRMESKLLNKLMFICLHAPKIILALKTIVNDILGLFGLKVEIGTKRNGLGGERW